MKAHTETVTIETSPKKVFNFLERPENMPKWAVKFCQGIRRDGQKWMIQTPYGEMSVRYMTDAETGVIDFYTSPAPGVEGYVASRVISNGQGAEYVFTFFQSPDLSDEIFAGQVEALKHEFGVLKNLMEKG